MPALPPTQATLASFLQQRNLATLLAALGGDGLAAGRTVEARLIALAADGSATASIAGTTVSLVLAGPEARQAALQPGTNLILKLIAPQTPGAPLQAELIGLRQPGQPPAPPGTPPAPPRAANGQQAPTMVPPAGQGSAGAPTAVGAASPQPAPAMQAHGSPETAATAASPRAMAGPLLGQALSRQNGLAPLFANLDGLAAGSVALVLPKPLLALIDRLRGQRLPADGRPLSPETLKAAIAGSGLFLEARQAAGTAPPPRGDLKADLQALRDMLRPALAPAEGQPAATAAGRATTHAATGSAALPLPESEEAGRPQPTATALPPRDTPTPARSMPPPPPREGLLTPQPAVEASLGAAARPAAIVQALFDQAEAALDRITLAQYASLPQEAARADQPGQARWLLELPLALQTGTAVLPLEIERDPPQRQPGASTEAPIWRVRFVCDLEPLGALQGLVTLQGRAISVSFWVEREDTGRLLRHAAPDLEASLLRARFDSASLDVVTGLPRAASAAPGRFLDRRS